MNVLFKWDLGLTLLIFKMLEVSHSSHDFRLLDYCSFTDKLSQGGMKVKPIYQEVKYLWQILQPN